MSIDGSPPDTRKAGRDSTTGPGRWVIDTCDENTALWLALNECRDALRISARYIAAAERERGVVSREGQDALSVIRRAMKAGPR